MYLQNLIKSTRKEYQKISINGISFDSRKVKKKNIFFAIKGTKTSGNNFINEAISRGASAIVIDKKTKIKKFKTPIIKVVDVRKELSKACAHLYTKKPSNVIAVTGTNGKSSVVNFFYQILNLNKIAVASIGTLGIFSKNYNKKTNLTSIDSLSLHKVLQNFKKKRINNVILEASSHGLDQKRLDNIKIKTGIFTNLSHDHLDYHKNMQSYFNSKMHLFKKLLKKNSIIITDEEIKEYKSIKSIAKKRDIRKITIGTNSGNIKVLSHMYDGNNQLIKILFNGDKFTLKIPLIGYFQVKNLLMAILAAFSSGLSKEKILNNIHKIKPVTGRLECLANLKNNSNIILDFAHTPEALEQSLIALKNQFSKKIILVFGCGGDRDKKKRFIMGKIANKYCHKVFVTDDNPRSENPKKIRHQIIKGCNKKAVEVGNRKIAIEKAIKQLSSNEILLVSGKGHETTQTYRKKNKKFSDREVIKKIIKKKKFPFFNKNNQDSILQKLLSDNNLNYSGASINTKTIEKNNLFFAIKGKNTDGHKFAVEAIKKGAAKLILNKTIKKIPKKKFIKVKNVFLSLNNLAKSLRVNSKSKIIGITGSAGKTTLKNLTGFILKNYGNTVQSPHSYNNRLGVPLSLCSLKNNTDYGVFELGMDKKGEIDKLSKIIKPEIGVITNISGAHFKNFKTLKDIAKAKGEIIDNIVENGKIILNKDDKFFTFLSNIAKKKQVKIFSFSSKKKADVYLLGISKIKNYYKLKINVRGIVYYFNSNHSTENFISNILACISVLFLLNLNLNIIKNKFINFKIPSGRGDIKVIKKFNKKFKFIDESYNANPLSMLSAIKNMNYMKRKNNERKLVFLGDMLELGNKSKNLHIALSTLINNGNIDKVFVYGSHIKKTFSYLKPSKKGKIFDNLDDAYNYLIKIIRNNDLLMIKGSNATGLNQLSKNIKKDILNAI